MSAFPTLSQYPDVGGWEESRAYDPVIRSKSEGGYVKTRARYTRAPRKWKVTYEYLPAADKATLEEFEDSVFCGADAFAWTNPMNSTVHTVRFSEDGIKYTPQGSKLLWKVEFTLQEV